jgi:hypothetical protein
VESSKNQTLLLLKKELQRWLDNPNWPEFGPGIGRGPLDAGRMAARTTLKQVMNTIDDLLVAPEVFTQPNIIILCPVCREPERAEDIVCGVCLSCSDAITMAHNERRASIIVEVNRG